MSKKFLIEAIATLLCMMTGISTQAAGAAAAMYPQVSSSWKLATEDTEVVFSIQDGWPVLKTLASRATGYNWLASPIRERLMSAVELNGVVTSLSWRFEGAERDAQGNQLTFRYTQANPRLELRSIWRARPGHGPVEHWVTITNDSGHRITVTHQDSLALSGLRWPSSGVAKAWWINRGGSNATHEGGTFAVDLEPGFDQVLVSDPTDGSSPVPWMAIEASQTQGVYVGWEFSGVGQIQARVRSRNPVRLEVTVGLVRDFRTDVNAGETFLAPAAFVGCYQGDVDRGSYTLHRFILERLLPPLPPDEPYPTLAYNLYLDAGGNKAREDGVLSSAALCKRLGFETFVPDAMWFPKDGDWRWDPARFPNGEEPIEKYVHQNSMKLGLWVAWTHGGDSEYPQALNLFRRPDWFNEEVSQAWKASDINWSPLLDLGYDPARKWAEAELERIVSEYHLDYLKHDYSPIVTQCAQTHHQHHYGVDVSYWSALGYYWVMDALRQKFPNLIFEGCSGGGHIKDFGYVQRVHYIVTTDTLSALADRQSIYDSTFAFPPAVLMAYTYENFYNKTSDRPLPFLWRSAMMSAWQIDPTHSANWTSEEVAGVERATRIYKSWIRPILRDVVVHHILPRPDGLHWDGMFYWSPSLRRGTVYIFRPNNDQNTQHVRLKGLEPDGQYKIRSEDGSVAEGMLSGTRLMNLGLVVNLRHKYSSDLIYVEQSH